MAPFGGTQPAATTAAPTTPLGSALEAARTTDYARAETELRAIGGADKPVAQLALARILYEQGRYADADQAALHVGGTKDQQLRGLAIRARVLFAQGKRDEAVKLLETQKGEPGAAVGACGSSSASTASRAGIARTPTTRCTKIIEDYNDDDDHQHRRRRARAWSGRAAYLLRSPEGREHSVQRERAGRQDAASRRSSGTRSSFSTSTTRATPRRR